MFRFFRAFALAAGASGCIYPEYREGEWPTGMPPKTYYERLYRLDEKNQERQTIEDYFTWVIRFYKGYSLAEGWHRSEAVLFKKMTDEEYRLLAPKTAYLGHLMSAEWAKNDEVRRVDTKMLMLWGQVMRKALERGDIEPQVDRLIADVKGLLTDAIAPSEITKDRYKDVLQPRPTGDGDDR